jgi:hypothetical protein
MVEKVGLYILQSISECISTVGIYTVEQEVYEKKTIDVMLEESPPPTLHK